jgi:hypothetical protein
MISTFYFRVPIVIDKDNDELVFIEDIFTGSERNLICFSCGKSMIPVHKEGNKPKPYFRHKVVECSVKFESFIHWLSKKIFDELNSIKLPPIDFEFLYENYWANDETFIALLNGLFDDLEISKKFRDISTYNILLRGSEYYSYDSFESEVTSRNSIGMIRSDIVINSNRGKYSIEPFYSHQIDNKTLSVIKSLDYSTISVDLNKFLRDTRLVFSKERFKSFMKEDILSKQWVYINSDERAELLTFFIKQLRAFIVSRKNIIDDYQNIEESIEFDLNRREPYLKEIDKLREEMYIVSDKVSKLNEIISKITDKRSIVSNQVRSVNNEMDEKKIELRQLEKNFLNNTSREI